MAAIQFASNVLRKLTIQVAPEFLEGNSLFRSILLQEDGFLLTEYIRWMGIINPEDKIHTIELSIVVKEDVQQKKQKEEKENENNKKEKKKKKKEKTEEPKPFKIQVISDEVYFSAFGSCIYNSLNLQCPVILKLDGTTLTATIFESKRPINNPAVESHFKLFEPILNREIS